MSNLSLRMLPFLLIVSVALAGDHWGYGASDGPNHWKGTCQTGVEQSPIDLDPLSTTIDRELGALRLHGYNSVMHNFTVNNNGHTVVVQPKKDSKYSASMRGGGLSYEYKFMQLHFHWGKDDHTGSEHTVQGFHYPLEMHLVHGKVGSKNPKAERDGLAVLGVFFKLQDDNEKSAITDIVEGLPNVKENGASAPLNNNLNIRLHDLLPDDHSVFYRYNGSLTTPGCDEAVIWTVLAEPVPITKQQVKLELWGTRNGRDTLIRLDDTNSRSIHRPKR